MWVVSTIVGHRIEQGENYFAFSFTRFMSVCIFADSQFFYVWAYGLLRGLGWLVHFFVLLHQLSRCLEQ